MIQRIQTVYLLVTIILLSFILFFPIADFIRDSDKMMFSFGLKGLISDEGERIPNFQIFPLGILFALCLSCSFTTIFYFKKRMLQIRLSIVNIILLLGLQGLMFYYVKFAQSVLHGAVTYNLFFIFPLVGAILVFLALRAITKDEALVRSLDRLR